MARASRGRGVGSKWGLPVGCPKCPATGTLAEPALFRRHGVTNNTAETDASAIRTASKRNYSCVLPREALKHKSRHFRSRVTRAEYSGLDMTPVRFLGK